MPTELLRMDGARAALTDESIDDLRSQVRGAVVTPLDEGYANVRKPFNAMHEDRPALVVSAHGTADVVAAISFAREHGIELTVRGGGHSVAGLSSTDGGMLLDLSPMRAVEVDPDARIARVQGGALLADVDHETQAFGLAVPLGVVSQTGVGGLTLGGGYGWLRRKHGLACDNVVSAQVVCADGQLRTASDDVNPDLFWAIRGGGGNFGVVTSFTFRLHPVGPVVAFAGVFYPLDEAVDVLRAYRDYFASAPADVSAEAILFASRFPADPHLPEPVHGRQALVVGAVYAGDVDEGMEELQALRALGAPLADISQPMPYTAVQSAFDGFFPRGELNAYWKSLYVSELPDDVLDLMVERASERPAGGSEYELVYVDVYPMGGSVSRVDASETAFGERAAPFLVSMGANWTDPGESDGQRAWVRELWSDVNDRCGTGYGYLNFASGDEGELASEAKGALAKHRERLASVKKEYDPGNVFRRNNNIAPAE